MKLDDIMKPCELIAQLKKQNISNNASTHLLLSLTPLPAFLYQR